MHSLYEVLRGIFDALLEIAILCTRYIAKQVSNRHSARGNVLGTFSEFDKQMDLGECDWCDTT